MTAGATNSPVFDFCSLDYESAVEDLVRFSQVTFSEDLWTDYNDSNFGMGLIQNMAYATDLLAYTANAQSLETIVTTLIREQNFRNIAKSLDYTLKSAAPGSGTAVFTLDPAGAYPFTISKHLQVATQSGLVFQPDADVAVAAYGAGTASVPVTQGDEQFEEVVGTTDGLPNQEFSLSSANLIDGTLVFQVGLEAYTIVSNFISAGPTEKVVVLQTDDKGITSVIVGDGINGTIPPKNQTAKATYKTGGGAETNLSADTITQVVGTSDGSAIPSQILSVTNTRTTGGAPKQSLSNAKQNLPLSLKANDRCVTLGDYAATAVELVPGILKANAVSGSPFGGQTPVLLFVVPNGGGFPSDSLRNLTIVKLKDKRSAGKRIQVRDAVYVDILIESDTYVLPNSPALDVRNRQIQILTAKFALEAVTFGASFDLQQVYEDTNTTALKGIKRVFYKTFTVKPYYARHVNSPTTGTGTIEWIATNLDTVRRREWLVQVLPPSPPVNCLRFQVQQRRLGTVTSVTDTLVTDDSADYESNELAGSWFFHPRPEDSSVSFGITSNTANSISAGPGLLTYTEPDDPYVVEKLEAGVGKILRTTVTAGVVSSTTVAVASVDSWEVGDKLHFSDNPLDYFTVVTVGVADLTIDRPVTTAVSSSVDYVWVSSDGSVKFSVVNGGTSFVVGDELYVDTYPRSGDISLRPENFPQLSASNLFVSPIGGVK